MRLGDLLIRASVVSAQDVARALERMNAHGGRLGVIMQTILTQSLSHGSFRF